MPYTILAVDDEPANLRMLERLLRKDYHVLTATSGEEALEILRREAVEVIITDQRMPGMSGTDLLRESLHSSPHSARIILTGYTDLEALIEAINTSQVYKFVSKPWDPIGLKEIVDGALEEHRQQMDLNKLVGDLTRMLQSYPALFVDAAGHPHVSPDQPVELLCE